MRVVKKFPTEAEAQLAMAVLENEGILGLVEGANAQSALAAPLLTSVRLLVHENELDQAKEILKRAEVLPDVPAWTCGTCFKDVDAGFEVCWNCGAEYASRFQETDPEHSSDPKSSENNPAPHQPQDFVDAKFRSEAPTDLHNPYQSPVAFNEPMSLTASDLQENEQLERKVNDAFWAVVLGGGIFLGTVVSVMLLIQVAPKLSRISSKSRRRYTLAFWLCAMFLLIYAACFVGLLSGVGISSSG